jgi:hypothetical protein
MRVTQSLIVVTLPVYNAELVVRLALGASTIRVAMADSLPNHSEEVCMRTPVFLGNSCTAIG